MESMVDVDDGLWWWLVMMVDYDDDIGWCWRCWMVTTMQLDSSVFPYLILPAPYQENLSADLARSIQKKSWSCQPKTPPESSCPKCHDHHLWRHMVRIWQPKLQSTHYHSPTPGLMATAIWPCARLHTKKNCQLTHAKIKGKNMATAI